MASKPVSIAEAKKLRDRLEATGSSYQELLQSWRDLRDRKRDDFLKAFSAALPPELQKHWLPSQSNDVDTDIQALKALCASNEPKITLVPRVTEEDVISRVEQAERTMEALYREMNPIQVRLDMYDGIIAEAIAIRAIDRLGPGELLAEFADREDLESYAEAHVDDEDDKGDMSAKAEYTRAYRASESEDDQYYDPETEGRHPRHDRAYEAATQKAKERDGLRWGSRIVDNATFRGELARRGNKVVIETGMEIATVPLAACIDALEGYGVTVEGDRLVMAKDGQPSPDPALTAERLPYDGGGSLSGDMGQTVTMTQIRTPEWHCLIYEGVSPEKTSGDAEGIFICYETPFAKSRRTTGYYITGGHTKNRGANLERYVPVVLGLMVEVELLNVWRSVANAMVYAEAARDLYQSSKPAPNSRPAMDPTKGAKTSKTKDGAPVPQVGGDVLRVPGMDINIADMIGIARELVEENRNKDFFSGTGAAGEPAMHLARIQTAQLTKLVPIQTWCSETDIDWLEDIRATVAETGEPLYVHQAPAERASGEGPQPAEILELSAELAKLPFKINVVTGADTPEAQYARQQVSRAEVEFGTYGMFDHMEIVGVKDIQAALKRMAVAAIYRGVIGTDREPGPAVLKMIAYFEQRAQEYVDALTPPIPLAPPSGDPTMNTPTGDAMDQPGGISADQSLVADTTQGAPGSDDGGIPVAPDGGQLGGGI